MNWQSVVNAWNKLFRGQSESSEKSTKNTKALETYLKFSVEDGEIKAEVVEGKDLTSKQAAQLFYQVITGKMRYEMTLFLSKHIKTETLTELSSLMVNDVRTDADRVDNFKDLIMAKYFNAMRPRDVWGNN